jgi:hypothetical protein
MRTIKKISVVLVFGLALLSADTRAQNQNPTPLVMQAASASSTPSVSRPVIAAPPSLQAAIKALQDVKAANEETLKKQEATLQRLDELQKDAEQLKIFSKRG